MRIHCVAPCSSTIPESPCAYSIRITTLICGLLALSLGAAVLAGAITSVSRNVGWVASIGGAIIVVLATCLRASEEAVIARRREEDDFLNEIDNQMQADMSRELRSYVDEEEAPEAPPAIKKIDARPLVLAARQKRKERLERAAAVAEPVQVAMPVERDDPPPYPGNVAPEMAIGVPVVEELPKGTLSRSNPFFQTSNPFLTEKDNPFLIKRANPFVTDIAPSKSRVLQVATPTALTMKNKFLEAMGQIEELFEKLERRGKKLPFNMTLWKAEIKDRCRINYPLKPEGGVDEEALTAWKELLKEFEDKKYQLNALIDKTEGLKKKKERGRRNLWEVEMAEVEIPTPSSDFSYSVEIGKAFTPIRHVLAEAYLRLGDEERARKQVKEMDDCEFKTNFFRSRINKAYAAVQEAPDRETAQELRREMFHLVEKLSGEEKEMWLLRLASDWNQEKKSKEALKLVEAMSYSNEKKEKCLFQLAKDAYENKKFDRALKIVNKMSYSNENRAKARFQLACVYYAQGDRKNVIKVLKDMSYSDKGKEKGLFQLASEYYIERKRKKVIEVLGDLISSSERKGRCYLQLAKDIMDEEGNAPSYEGQKEIEEILRNVPYSMKREVENFRRTYHLPERGY